MLHRENGAESSAPSKQPASNGPARTGAYDAIRVRRVTERLLLYASAIFLALIFIVPYIWMLSSSFSTSSSIFRYVNPLSWRTFFPQVFTLENYARLLELQPYPFTRYLANSLFVSVTVTLLSLIVNALGAYAFARLRFPGRGALFALFLATVIIPFEVLAIPLYLEIRAFGWVDTYWALIVPWIAAPIGIFLLKQFFEEIPRDLEDAARIDGCGYLSTFWHVIVPNTIPALIAFALIRFQTSWDSFVWPLIAAPAPEMRVIQVAIATFTTETETDWGLTFAASVVATVPILILFLFLQRYYVQGMVMSGVKG